MIPVCIDIETRPRFLDASEMPALALRSKANRARTPETKAAWAADPDNQLTAWCRESLSLTGARVIAWAAVVDGQEYAASDVDEVKVLRRLGTVLTRAAAMGRIVWIGHNIAAFDLPLLRIAAMRHEMTDLRDKIPTYRYSKDIHDNMTKAVEPAGSFSGVSADALALALGLEGKGEIGDLDFPQLYRNALAGGLPVWKETAKLLEGRALTDVRVEWATYLRMTA